MTVARFCGNHCAIERVCRHNDELERDQNGQYTRNRTRAENEIVLTPHLPVSKGHPYWNIPPLEDKFENLDRRNSTMTRIISGDNGWTQYIFSTASSPMDASLSGHTFPSLYI